MTGAPLQVQNTSPVSLREMSNANMDYFSYVIQKNYFANVNSEDVLGSIHIAPALDTTFKGTMSKIGEHTDISLSANVGETVTTFTTTYTGFYANAYAGSYTGFFANSFSSNFAGSYSQAFAGNYQGSFAGNYVSSFARFYSGFLNGYFSTTFTGYYNRWFTGFYTGFFTGFYTGFFTSFYANSFTGFYSNNYAGSYANTGEKSIDPATYTTAPAVEIYQQQKALVAINVPAINRYMYFEPSENGIKQIDIHDETPTEFDFFRARVASNLTDLDGVGVYQLRPGNPTANGYTGTWTQRGSLTDYNADGSLRETTYLWQKTDDTPPTERLPLKILRASPPVSIIEMSNTDMDLYANAVWQYMVDNNLGQYVYGANSPATGTWVQAGEAFDDTQSTISAGFEVEVGTTTKSSKSLWLRVA